LAADGSVPLVALDPRTPVLVGAAAVSQRFDDPRTAREAVGLMIEACTAAAVDAGDTGLLRAADAMLVPKGTWPYGDAGRLVAAGVGNTTARTLAAEVGILQTTLFDRAARDIAAGHLDVVVIAGGEARWRQLSATIAGIPLSGTDDGGARPDEVLAPKGMIISPEEIGAGLVTAVSHYAMIETARRAADGQSLDAHSRVVADLCARFNLVARANPDAWNRRPMSADDIRGPGAGNRTLASPYNKWHCSQWNVDQAAALILCSAEVAQSRGIARDRWVFPHAIAESNAVVPLSQRRELHRCAGFSVAGTAAMDLAGVGIDDLAHIDLYSCFPIAVRVQAAELGLSLDRPLTVTGGMTFAGGPLNNYVLQAVAKMATVLRADPGANGLVTAVSGMLTKQGVSVWSARPPAAGYRSEDVSDRVAAAAPAMAMSAVGPGPATVATYTVIHVDGHPTQGVVIAEHGDGCRAIATTGDRGIALAMTTAEWCGRTIDLDGAGGFTPR
jgi:acetyl-CoA C-acetyltransferase